MTDVCPNCGSVSIASNPKDLRRTAAAAAMASSNPVLSVLGAVGGALNAGAGTSADLAYAAAV